ncbi:FecR domain-containing protein [Thermogutta sp.]|uniref:FecR domain-containing protein n=1 Tax=Thermogutta sp. TaxID=1962930 RepID=UPI003C7BB639
MNAEERASLCQLVDALVEGRGSDEDVRCLEELARTPEGRKLYIEYVLLLGELHWGTGNLLDIPDSRADADVPTIAAEVARTKSLASQKKALRRVLAWGLAGIAAAMSLCVVLLWRWYAFHQPGVTRPQRSEIATCVDVFEADFDTPHLIVGSPLKAGDVVCLRSGLAAWRDRHGTTWTLEGPAALRVDDAQSLTLTRGKMVVQLAPGCRSFLVKTPHARIADRGTSFAVEVASEATRVHVLTGKVALAPLQPHDGDVRELRKGEAAMVSRNGRLLTIPWRGDRFWTDIPKKGSVAAWRYVAVHDPHIWLSADFEQEAAALYDHRDGHVGNIFPVRMRGTFSDVSAQWEVGYEGQSRAARVIRANRDGNSNGLGWQTEEPLTFPNRFTAEIIFRFDGWSDQSPQAVGSLLATRQDTNRCGFLLAALPSETGAPSEATLVHLLVADDNWAQTRGRLAAGHWYFAVVIVRTDEERKTTHICTYLQDLSAHSRLEKVFEGRLSGTVPSGPLGIGKGFDARLAHAYPFPGAIDEVCFYNEVMEEETVRRHADFLVTQATFSGAMPLPGDTPEGRRIGDTLMDANDGGIATEKP